MVLCCGDISLLNVCCQSRYFSQQLIFLSLKFAALSAIYIEVLLDTIRIRDFKVVDLCLEIIKFGIL